MPADLNDYFNKKNSDDKKMNFKAPQMPNFGKFAGLIYAILAVIVIAVIARPFVVIQSGEVGILSTAGKYNPTPLQPGFHLFIPFVQNVIVVDTRVRLMNYTSTEDTNDNLSPAYTASNGIITKNAISVLDARNLPVSVNLTVQYSLNPSNAPQTISRWGLSWENKIVDPVVRDVVRSVIGKYTAEQLPIKRDQIATQIEDGIRKSIDSQPNSPVELLTVQLREIILPAKIKDQIERVQIAKQEAEKAKYEVEQANQQALKQAALAKGNADATKIEAQGRADAIKIEADAQSYANKEIAGSLSENLLRLKEIQTQGKFNEALRVNKDAKIFLTPGGVVPNIWVNTQDKRKQSALIK